MDKVPAWPNCALMPADCRCGDSAPAGLPVTAARDSVDSDVDLGRGRASWPRRSLGATGRGVQDCPDEVWRSSMWRVVTSEIVGDVRDAGGQLDTDPA